MNRRNRLGAAAGGLVLAIAGVAGAQSMGMISDDEQAPGKGAPPKDVRPPAPTDPGKPAVVVPYLLTFVLGGLAVGLAVMPSGRSHQD
jgi:hypothetical protein